MPSRAPLLLLVFLLTGCARAPHPPSDASPSSAPPGHNSADSGATAKVPPPPPARSSAPVKQPESPPAEKSAGPTGDGHLRDGRLRPTGSDGFGEAAKAQPPDAEAQWFADLQKGFLKQYVPSTMLWKVPSTVSVVVGGERADAATAPSGATGSANVKVTRQMRVVVLSPDNPDEFVITPEPDTQEVMYVPEDGTTTWNYSVTPRYTGRSQKIAVRAWVVYPGAKEEARELPVYTASVDVHVPGLGECLKRLLEGDPDYWLKYGLPGGAGFVFVSGAFAGVRKWLLDRRKSGSAQPAARN